MKIFFRYILLSTTLLLTLTAKSQRFPVQANVQLLPPYSISLADYASPEVDRVRLSLLLLDLTQPTYDVRLRLVIEGTGIRIETDPAFSPAPITIESGAPTILTGIDLAPYFDIRNLLFSGISKQQYERQGVLPEGFYRFTLQVTDARRRDRVLARDAFAQAWLALGEPPLLNTPFCGSEVRINEGQQNVLFSWTPIGISPNAAMGTEYEFTLVEVRPSGRNPNDAINTSRPIYQVTTDATSLVYGITEPPLLEGVTYAWRIRAIDRNGLDRFKNQGYSKVCSFIVPEEEVPLGAPTDVSASPETERSARVTWRTVPEGNGYRVEYREADNPNAEWFGTDDPTQDGELVVTDLRPATEYETRVAGLRSNFAGTWSETVTFTTFPPRVFECGDPATVSGPTNTEPLMTALVGSVFKVGEFDMVVTSIQGGNGTFSGTGAVLMPFPGFRINSRFTNIKVNELQEVIDGEVIALSDGVEGLIDRWEGDGDTDLDINGDGPDIGEGTDAFVGVDVTVDGTIDTVYVNDEGDIVVVTEDGNTEIIDREVDEETGEAGDDIRITDSDGGQVIVDGDTGTVKKNGETVGGQGGSGTDPNTDKVTPEHERLLTVILEDFEKRIGTWLETNGKGPLDNREMTILAEGLPGCMDGQDVGTISKVLDETIPSAMEDKKGFIGALQLRDGWEDFASASKDGNVNSESKGLVCYDLLVRSINCLTKKEGLPKGAGKEGEKRTAHGQRFGNGGNLYPCETDVYYFSGHTESYPMPEGYLPGQGGAGWYKREEYVELVERAVTALAIVTGDVELFARNEAGILASHYPILQGFSEDREMDDAGFADALKADYGRIAKGATDRYSGKGNVKEVYPIYEVLSIFTGQQLLRGILKFGFVFRRFRSIKGLISFKVTGGTLRVLGRQGDEIAKVVDGKLQPTKFIDDGTVIKEMPEGILVRKSEEIGFKKVGNIADNWFDDLPAGLKDDIGKLDSELGKLFANASDYRRLELQEAWEIMQKSAFKADGVTIKKLSDYIKNCPRSTEQISKSFNAAADKAKWFKYLDDEFEVMYRSISKEEYEQLVSSSFNFKPKDKYINGKWVGYDGYEGKLFTKTYREVIEHSKDLANPIIIEVRIPKTFRQKLVDFIADGKSAIAVDKTQMDVFNGLHISKKID